MAAPLFEDGNRDISDPLREENLKDFFLFLFVRGMLLRSPGVPIFRPYASVLLVGFALPSYISLGASL